jgi:hypothetical protein
MGRGGCPGSRFNRVPLVHEGAFALIRPRAFTIVRADCRPFDRLEKVIGLERRRDRVRREESPTDRDLFFGCASGGYFRFRAFHHLDQLAVAKQIFASFGFFGTLEDLSSFRIPFLGVWLVIGALSLFLANSYLWQQDTLSFVLINLFIVLFALYFFQGLAIASFYLTLNGVTPWMRLLFYSLLLIFFESLGLFLVGVGFFDSWFNFRKKNVHPSA